jgi:uncharacterized membrane protein
MKLYQWLMALHVVGAILWVGGLTAVLALLHVHARVDEAARGALASLERRIAMAMDVGATLTIAVGLYTAIRWNHFSHGGWLHIKLTAVVLGVLSVHGLARARIKQARQGNPRAVPAILWIALAVGMIAAATLGANRLLLRG